MTENQISFLTPGPAPATEEELYQRLLPIFSSALERIGLSPASLEWKKNKGNSSVTFAGQFVCRLQISQKSGTAITFKRLKPDDQSLLDGMKQTTSKTDNAAGFCRIVLSDGQVTGPVEKLAEAIFSDFLDRLDKDFDCCSRYESCSNAGRCVHPDADFAIKCGYMQNLRKGLIFYGANAK